MCHMRKVLLPQLRRFPCVIVPMKQKNFSRLGKQTKEVSFFHNGINFEVRKKNRPIGVVCLLACLLACLRKNHAISKPSHASIFFLSLSYRFYSTRSLPTCKGGERISVRLLKKKEKFCVFNLILIFLRYDTGNPTRT